MSGPFLRLRDHFTLEQWREMLGMQRVAECEARRLRVPFTQCDEVHGTRALIPLHAQMGDSDRARETARAAIAKAAESDRRNLGRALDQRAPSRGFA